MATDTVGNTLPIVTTSERTAFRRCPQFWWWKYREGLSPLDETPDSLWFGQGIHIALAAWYQKGKRRGPHPADTFEAWVGEEIREIRAAYADHDREWYDEPKFEEASELGINMLEHYVETYGKDPRWRVLATEEPFRVLVSRRGTPVARFMSTWDGVIRDEGDGRIYLVEHKTASQISLAYLELDDQAGVYWAVASNILRARKVLRPGEEIAGIVYNFLRKSRKDERPQDETGAYHNKPVKDDYVTALTGVDGWEAAQLRKMKLDELDSIAAANHYRVLGKVSERQPPPLFVRHIVERLPSEQRRQMERLADEVTVMNAMRSGALPVFKNTTRECTWCMFFDMCQLHEHGGSDWQEIMRASYRRANPYDRYIKSAGNGA
jgi:PD-(D/E)XK nuclease superfamily